MFLNTNPNLTDFFAAVHKCSGDVEFISSEKAVLNLKSEFSQFVFLASYAEKDCPLEGDIICHNPQDIEYLKPFLK